LTFLFLLVFKGDLALSKTAHREHCQFSWKTASLIPIGGMRIGISINLLSLLNNPISRGADTLKIGLIWPVLSSLSGGKFFPPGSISKKYPQVSIGVRATPQPLAKSSGMPYAMPNAATEVGNLKHLTSRRTTKM
jgi:hypothetical protein